MTKVYAVTIKGYGKDEFGLQQYEWATEKQVRRILNSQNDSEHRDDFFQLGERVFRCKDIVQIKEMQLEYATGIPSFRGYVLEQIDREEREEAEKLEGRKRYEELKQQHEIKGIQG